MLSHSIWCQKSYTDNIIYTGIINSVPDGFSFPLIGVLNIANGNYNGFQLGVINHTEQNQNGVQIGCINTTKSSFDGAKIGFINAAGEKLDGASIGFINANGARTDGSQIGFVNVSNGKVDGIQVGFVNIINDSLNGAQIAFVNANNGKSDGSQIGYVNKTKVLNGFQLGFVNVCDSIESGFPIGFVSVVRKGGYRSFGYFANEFSPYNLAFRIGIKNLYTTFVASYDVFQNEKVAVGAGLGTLLPISKNLFINPEILSISNQWNSESYSQYSIVSLTLGYDINQHISFSIGPTASWNISNNNYNITNPMLNFGKFKINHWHEMSFGFRTGVNINF